MPRAFNRLLAKLLLALDGLMTELEGGMGVDAWRDAFARELARYHAAALLVGQGGGPLTDVGRRRLTETVAAQLSFLDGFALEVQGAEEFKAGWRARASLYAEGVKQSYWSGATRFLPLPAMPGDGTTQCVTRCRCMWDIVWLDEDAGDADATWRLNPAEHCQTCLARAEEWAPLRIRGGRVQ